MTLDRPKLMIVAFALVVTVLAFVIVFQLGYDPQAQYEKPPPDKAFVEPPDSESFEEMPVKRDTPPEERKPVTVTQGEAGEDVPYGELRWTPVKTEKKDPDEGLSTHDRDKKTIKPETKDGSAVR